MPTHKFKLIAVKQETPDVRTYRFEPLGKFKSGQFVLLRYDGEARPYSISSPATETRFIELTIRAGPENYFPKKLLNLNVGDVVELDGPHGQFVLSGSKRDAVFIGAGVGIAGLRGLWSEIFAKNPKSRVTIIYSARTEDELIWLEDLGKSKAKIVLTLTREQPADWTGETGRIDDEMIKRYVPKLLEKEYYICGPPEMVDGTKEALLSLGVPEGQIFAESWGGIAGGE